MSFGDNEEREEELSVCLECLEDFYQQTDVQLCDKCMKLFDTDKLWDLNDKCKLNALDFNESKKMREKFRIKEKYFIGILNKLDEIILKEKPRKVWKADTKYGFEVAIKRVLKSMKQLDNKEQKRIIKKLKSKDTKL